MDTNKELGQLGWSIESSNPVPYVKDNWVAVAFATTLLFNGRAVWTGQFKMGIGCVDLKKRVSPFRLGLVGNEHNMFEAMRRNPRAQFKDKHLQASVCAKLARVQRVKPDLSSVVNCCMLDGIAFFHAQTFEDWCMELGFDPDSIKALEIYNECDKTGRELARNVPKEALDSTTEILQDY